MNLDNRTRVLEEGIEGLNTYVLEEDLVGTFLTKPRYRAVFTPNVVELAVGNFNIDITNLDVDKLTRVSHLIEIDGELQTIYASHSPNSEFLQVFISGVNNEVLEVYSGNSLFSDFDSVVIVIEYTKTTD